MKAERELLDASKELVEATNEVTQLLNEKPFGWHDKLTKASKRKNDAQEAFKKKSDAYLKCKKENPDATA